jgi:glycosyltransferase involved in cell wall biosynthesis
VTRMCFLIRQLNAGGAERQLVTLAGALDKTRYDVAIVTFYSGGSLSEEASQTAGLRIISLNKNGRWDLAGFYLRLLKELRELNPDILHSYLPGANVLAALIKPWLPKTRIVWGIRASNVYLGFYHWSATALFKLECLLSRFADIIIANSRAGRNHCVANGFLSQKVCVVPNGIDIKRFSPDPPARKRVREEWGIKNDEIAIGLVARFDPMKDYPTFLRAASIFLHNRDDIYFVCVGDGDSQYKSELYALVKDLGLQDRVLWIGGRSDTYAVHNALDIVTSASITEGFSNSIGEAMACGTPCVVTDVGDSAWIVGDTGVVVPPRDPQALVEGWKTCLGDDPDGRGRRARERIVENFSICRLVKNTEEALWPKD